MSIGSTISPYGQNIDARVEQLKATASNIVSGTNPSYVVADFVSLYPQFGPDVNDKYVVPETILQVFIDLANVCILQARYKSSWQLCMGLFVAHWATMWLQSTADAGSPAAKVIAIGQAKGLRVSKSVGPISTSIDYNTVAQDLDGWAAWKLTTFGQQLATMAKMFGKGGMMIW